MNSNGFLRFVFPQLTFISSAIVDWIWSVWTLKRSIALVIAYTFATY